MDIKQLNDETEPTSPMRQITGNQKKFKKMTKPLDNNNMLRH